MSHTRIGIGLAVILLTLVVTSASVTAQSQKWIEVDAPGGKKIRAAVVRPQGDGPFPVVVVFHGTEGFRQSYIDIATYLAQNGFVGVAGCWFAGNWFQGQIPERNIDCPQGPDFKGTQPAAVEDALALVEAARRLPGARPDRVGLFGHSRGGTIALVIASGTSAVQAVVASGAIYTQPKINRPPYLDTLPITLVDRLQAPLLILHGTADEIVPVAEARTYEAQARAMGKDVEAVYYQGIFHGVPFHPQSQADVRRRTLEFFKKHLAR